ncbi:Stp1/IreP family PP2C-type Ser/Thr phosphatase [Ectothiorhodospiraceae bacterium WFHF3C12]|nr:Stp1/IreP family PP2C-type Ser/Thr phosphatase [Ectothiorhodospiraceae bacterium WFHF3C12]
MRMAGLSDVGRVRARNEDAADWDERAGVAMVADGMGGHPAGDVASNLAVRTVMDAVRGASAMDHWLASGGDPSAALEAANAAVLEDARRHPERHGMGTTGVVAALHDGRCRIAHVGDSRAYQLKDGMLKQLTRDHTAAQQALDQQLITPEQARHTPERHQLTRALGLDPTVQADIHDTTYERGDLFLLCSDGLTEMLDDDPIRDALAENSRDPDAACRLLVRLALDHGGVDNVTVVVVVAS